MFRTVLRKSGVYNEGRGCGRSSCLEPGEYRHTSGGGCLYCIYPILDVFRNFNPLLIALLVNYSRLDIVHNYIIVYENMGTRERETHRILWEHENDKLTELLYIFVINNMFYYFSVFVGNAVFVLDVVVETSDLLPLEIVALEVGQWFILVPRLWAAAAAWCGNSGCNPG